MLTIILAGALGGLLRGLFGLAKDLALKKEPAINWPWLIATILISALLGAVISYFFSGEWIMAFLGGYSGTDFIDGLIEIRLNRLEKGKPQEEPPSKTGTLSGYLKSTGNGR